MPEPISLFGDYHVTPTHTALKEAQDLFPKYGDYQELRRHALKLAFWPKGPIGSGGMVIDLDWEVIKGMSDPKACELRITDKIGGFDNLRLVFYRFEKDVILTDDILPRLWVIGVMQKKLQRFSNAQLRIFSARVTVLRQRKYYEHIGV